MKILVYDGQGFCLFHKRLSSGKFRWWPARPTICRCARTATRTLAAHQMHVLLSAGNPESTQAAPLWRPVGRRGEATCQVQHPHSLNCSCVFLPVRGTAASARTDIWTSHTIRSPVFLRGWQFSLSAVGGIIMPPETDDHELDMDKLDEILRRVEAKDLRAKTMKRSAR